MKDLIAIVGFTYTMVIALLCAVGFIALAVEFIQSIV